MENGRVKNYIREWRNKRGLSQEQLAAEIGTTKSKVSKLERGDQRLDTGWMSKLAGALGVSPVDLLVAPSMKSEPEQELRPAKLKQARIPIIGNVAAGKWLEIDPLNQDEQPLDYINFIPDSNLPLPITFGLVVEGPSLNKIAPPGSVLICVSLADAGMEALNGQLIVVERSRDNHELVEITAKRVRYKPSGAVELWPESNHPDWQDPIILDGKDTRIEVEVKAVVKRIIITP